MRDVEDGGRPTLHHPTDSASTLSSFNPDKFELTTNHTSMWNGNTSLQRQVPGVTWPYPHKSRSISRSRFLRTGRQVALRRLAQTVHQSSLRFLSMVLYADSSSDSHLKLDDPNNTDAVRSHFSDSIKHKPRSGLGYTAVLLVVPIYIFCRVKKSPNRHPSAHATTGASHPASYEQRLFIAASSNIFRDEMTQTQE
jgi:hypothetical protein